ncbi:class I SAM-dependent methyltransferase [Plastoroseomonas arctica]|uniref:Class I SAM-dependent methyltransferase n=1 Tax=Plastoroseomonas arctica TaxID=1509237 RepID=A0AAF1JU94_9PROT|nr:class I SAM-dependent methyltransferase [Plastoroseomonas arctica]MBR0653707.1 class I SAM-dependent methyltransferase [Plastoroseomonas arctica]
MASPLISRLLFQARKRMPAGLRHALRLGAHMTRRGQASPPIPPELLRDCRVVASRQALVESLPREACVLEVGTDRGDFANFILQRCAPRELHIVDVDLSRIRADVASDPRVTLHQGLSHERIAAFPDAHFDWIYIDADHSYDGVARDAAAAAAKLRPGGALVFNDFAHADPFLGAYGVHRAAVEFAVNHRWPLTHMAYEGAGLYDLALRRPE